MRKIIFSVLILLMHSFAFSQITLTSTVSNVNCFGGTNGSATVTASGGTAPYTYTWMPSNMNSPTLSGLAAGAYTVTVMDALANTSSLVVNISQPTQLTATASVQNSITCMCNGSASLTVSGGTAPYSYNWPGPFNITTAYNNNLCPGVSTASVTDINGCVVTQTVAIMPAPTITIAISATNAACQTYCNGAASATVTGGTPNYTFNWYGPSIASGSSTSNPMGMCPGTYSFVVTDAMGCQTFTSVNISVINAIPNTTVTNTIYNETCLSSGDGAIDISITGTNPGPFTYQWNNGATTQDLNNISSSSYLFTVYDSNFNCVTIYNIVGSIGTNCGTISGNVFIDNNSDCINNAGDNNFSGTSVLINPGNRIGYTNLSGNYTVNNLPYGTYTITANTNSFYYLATCNTSYTTTVNGGSPNSINKNFSRENIPVTKPDHYVSAYSNGIVPGFVCFVRYQLNNLNSIAGTGLYKAVLPSAFIPNITAGIPATYTVSGDTVTWNFSNIISASGTQFFQIYFTVPLSTPLGSIFSTCMEAQPNLGDFDPTNNTNCYSRMVMGSFDPNDKTVSPVGVGANGDIAASVTDLTYLIRFQNTGNGPAVNIKVTDTLSSNVNVNTFEMLGASHNYNIDILPGNVLRWKFNNIMLPDSNSNEPASHGYIQYRIKRTTNNTPGTQIKNTANIYFDFNEPVITNTAINTIETITGIHNQNISNDQWIIYPNPSTGIINLVNNSITAETKLQIQVINSFGQLVYEESIHANSKMIDLNKLSNGVYFVKLISNTQNSVKRIVLSK